MDIPARPKQMLNGLNSSNTYIRFGDTVLDAGCETLCGDGFECCDACCDWDWLPCADGLTMSRRAEPVHPPSTCFCRWLKEETWIDLQTKFGSD